VTGNIIAIASGKGGVGKTFFSISLATALAQNKRRVLLFDGDLGLANVDIQMGVVPQSDVGLLLREDVDPLSLVEHDKETGVDFLAGPSGSDTYANLNAGELALLGKKLEKLRHHYDDVIFDLSAGVSKTVSILASSADQILMVFTPDPTSLTDAYACVKVFHQKKVSDRVRLVVNVALDRVQAAKTCDTLLRACQTFLQIKPPYLGFIPRDSHVTMAIRAQKPLLLHAPNCAAAQAVRDIAHSILLP
jgi:flagellar biosynthesis protein FlhG